MTYDRKMREMVVASRIERTLSKREILLEIYLNSILSRALFLGHRNGGFKLFWQNRQDANRYGGGASPPGLRRAQTTYNPDLHVDRAQERVAYVVSRMREDGVLTSEQAAQALESLPQTVGFQLHRRTDGIPLYRSSEPRGADARRDRQSHDRLLCRPLHH